MHKYTDWRPSATLDTLRARARLFSSIRAYFALHGVMEVDTPALSRWGTVDRHIESIQTADGRWLHTSPEFAMKRLLAAGSGAIYQICHVFRSGEQGRLHQSEFTMLEWYRSGMDHFQLMSDVQDLFRTLVGIDQQFDRISYQQAFWKHAGLDPRDVSIETVQKRLFDSGVSPDSSFMQSNDLDDWLDLAMAVLVTPKLGSVTPCFIYDYPSTQCGLARICRESPTVADRFELFWRGVELANGYYELADAEEYRQRFETDLTRRRLAGKALPQPDEALIAAAEHGLPDMSGVALGVDRLLALMLGLPDISEVVSFDSDRI